MHPDYGTKYDYDALDPDIAKYEADYNNFDAKEKAEETDEKNTLLHGFGLLKKKNRSKLSKLDGVSLEDISSAIYDKIQKKKNDKRRYGGNRVWSQFQTRDNGKFTNKLLNLDEIKKKILNIAYLPDPVTAINMLNSMKDSFTANEYEELYNKINRPPN